MLTSYHVHSNWSDGESSIREIAESAVRNGLDELGISDHFVLSPYGKVECCMSSPDLPGYVAEISEIKKEFEDKLIIRHGIEADYFPETADELADLLKSYPFDYVIGSVHFVDSFPVDQSKDDWDAISQEERDQKIIGYWDRIKRMAESGVYDFAGHLDLYKKYGHSPSIDVTKMIDAALDAIAKSRLPIEINTAGWFKDVAEAYPSKDILTKCYQRDIPILITADAHNSEHIIRSFDKAASIAKSIGFTKQAVFSERNMRLVPLI